MRGQEGRELAEHGELGSQCNGAGADGQAELAQEQHLLGLAGIISLFPAPRAFGIAGAERLFHGGA